MRSPPLDVILSWPEPNYVNPETRGPALLIVQCIILPLAWITLCLRMYVRLVMLRRSWWDDWIMLAAAVFTTGVSACVILATQRYGWDLHVWDVPVENLIAGRKISIAGQTIFCFASGLAKISIVLSYLRIATPKSKFRYFTWAALGVIVAALCIFIIVLWTQCIPAHKYWDLFDNNRHCVEEGPPLMGQIAVTILTDILVYVLPMPTLVRLNLPWSQRIILLVVFGFGAVVVVAGIMRLYYVHLTVYETYDVTWVGYNLWIWTAVEVNLGIICGCVPALKPLAYKARTKISSSNYMKTHSSSSRKSKSYNRSNVRSSRPLDIELEDETTMVSKQGINVEKTIEWSQSDSTEYDASFHKTKHADHGGSWLEDGPESSQTSQIGQYGYGNSAEITRSPFGLKR